MAKTAKSPATKTNKSLKKEVAGTLTEIFTDIKDAVGNKKFGKKVKKASKILTAGALKKLDKKEKTKKEAPKKVKEVKKAAGPTKTAKPAPKKTKKQPKAAKMPSVPTPDRATT